MIELFQAPLYNTPVTFVTVIRTYPVSLRIKRSLLKVLLVLLLWVNAPQAYAEVPSTENEAAREAVTKQAENNYTTEFKKSPPRRIRQHLYESPVIKTFAYLHWAISMLDIKDDENIDTFLKITECDIYRKYKADEFEWEKIRSATRDYLNNNKADFPVRFELGVPLKLGEYNKEKSYFEIQKSSQVKSVRLFEMVATDSWSPLCGDPRAYIGKYYNGLILELSRPFSLTSVPVDNEKAQKIIEEKNVIYQEYLKKLTDPKFDQQMLLDLRDAYLYMYIKIFTYKGPYEGPVDEKRLALGQALAVVEGFEIFEDRERKNLLYSRNYITKRDQQKESQELEKEIKIVKEKIKNKGILF